MYFDRTNATLIASAEELTDLAKQLGDEGQVTILPEWEELNVSNDGQLDPTVAGIVEIMNRPLRSIALERFDGERVDVMFIAWDRAGRATMASGMGNDQLSIMATQFDLLPALITQAVRLHPKSAEAARGPITAPAELVRQVVEGSAPDGAAGAVAANGAAANGAAGIADPDLAAVLGGFRHAWRASGSWQGRATDTSMTVLFAGGEGLWTVEHDASTPGSAASADTTVRLIPRSPADIHRLLGDVVTGRNSVPVGANAA